MRASQRVTIVVAALASLFSGLAIATAAPAQAEDCKVKVGPVKLICGRASNNTSSTMLIAKIGSGGKPCAVHDRWSGKKISGSWTCRTRKLGAGKISPLTGEFADVDAITFPGRKFRVNSREYSKGQFVKIPSLSAVRCVNIKLLGWDSQPQCLAP